MLANIGLAHIRVLADPPYVALIGSQWWRVKEHDVILKLCTREDIKVVHLILEHVHTNELLRCFNAHMPSKAATNLRKEMCVKKMCHMATDPPILQQPLSSVDAHRAARMPWIIAGDVNVDSGTMAKWCANFVKNGDRWPMSFSKSEWPTSANAHKADYALSQGIALDPCRS